MKTTKLNFKWVLTSMIAIFMATVSTSSVVAQQSKSKQNRKQQIISYVDTSLDGSQKYLLMVDGKPYYMTNIQVRLDLLRYSLKWNAAEREAIIAQAAADGFNTVSIPIHWYEVEKEKNKFDWSILNEYLGLVNKYNIKMEMLWFGANSGGHVQWLGRSQKEGNHLRTPDYVLYSPALDSKETTSEYTIRRDMTPYTLDMGNNRLRERETYVLSQVMKHISQWDKKHESKHPVIGVQIGNEVIGRGTTPFSNSLAISYLSDVAGAVKNSDYVLWTRVNCVFWKIPSRICENEEKRLTPQGTNLDFIGIDTYRHHFLSDADFVASMRTNLPYTGKNFRMIMETNSDVPYAAQMHLAALSGNNAFDFYTIESLYDRDGTGKGVKAKVKYIDDIRLVNKILTGSMADVARNAHGYGLFVHNWQGVNSTATTSNAGITFVPDYPTSQGISIQRSPTEIVLMSTKGGRFILPDSVNITELSKGYFNTNNTWINQGEVSLYNHSGFDSGTTHDQSIYVEPGIIIRLTKEPDIQKRAPRIYQAEFARLSGGAKVDHDIANIGFAGNGYVAFSATGGEYITWTRIDGEKGGERTINIRYSHPGTRSLRYVLSVNGKEYPLRLQPTETGDTYRLFPVKVSLNAGKDNVVRLETLTNHYRINRAVYSAGGGNVDELQILQY